MDFIAALFIIFVAAKLAGEGMERIHQSPLIGEVLAGILLGPMLLHLIDPDPATSLGSSLKVVSDLGVLVLVLLAGIELGREGLRQAIRERSIVVAMVEFVFPFALGYGLAALLGMNAVQAIFLGTAMAVTALPVSVRILLDLNLLHSRLGRAIVSVAMANDLMAFAMLGLVVELIQTIGGPLELTQVVFIVAKNIAFLGLVLGIGIALNRTMRPDADGGTKIQTFIRKLRGQEAAFAFGVAIALLLGAAADLVGIHFAVGVFYGGVLITPGMVGKVEFNRIQNSMRVVTFGLLAPIFFAFVGLNVRWDFAWWPVIVIVTGVAFAGKFLGGIIGGIAAGFRGAPLVALGVGLNARGMMELLLAQVGLVSGIIGPDVYSALIVMTLVTTFMTPPLLKRLMRRFTVKDVLPEPAPRPKEETAS